MNQKKRMHSLMVIVFAILLILAMIALILTRIVFPRQKYTQALALLENEEYAAAYSLLGELGKDDLVVASLTTRADALLKEGETNEAYALLAGVADTASRKKRMGIKQQQIAETPVGSFFTLGSYEQDNKTANGPEPIE